MQCITSIVNSAFEGAGKNWVKILLLENRNIYKTKLEMFIVIAYSIIISQKKIRYLNFLK